HKKGESFDERGVASTTYIGTTGGVARRLSSIPPAIKRLSPKTLAAGVAIVGLGGLAGGYALLHGRHRQPEPPVVASADDPPPPVATQAPPPEPAGSAAPDPKRTARVTVPAKATVTVDGK